MASLRSADEVIYQAIRDMEGSPSASSTDLSIRVIDLENVRTQLLLWREHMNSIQPYYAMKCNRDPRIFDTLSTLGACFNCSSPGDVMAALQRGCDPTNITLTHPYKSRALLRLAREKGIRYISFDTTDELDVIQNAHPQAQLFLRLATTPIQASGALGDTSEFGVPLSMAMTYLESARSQGLEVVGLISHCEANDADPASFCKSMAYAIHSIRDVYRQAVLAGFDLSVIDIGGGFSEASFPAVAEVLNTTLRECFPPDVRIIAEPGRFFVHSSVTVASRIVGIRSSPDKTTSTKRTICMNDSIFENFAKIVIGVEPLTPELFKVGGAFAHRESLPESSSHQYTICGSTLYTLDKFVDSWSVNADLKVDDWLVFRNLGAYSTPPRSNDCHFVDDEILRYIEVVAT